MGVAFVWEAGRTTELPVLGKQRLTWRSQIRVYVVSMLRR
jgi:hypothetical protein